MGNNEKQNHYAEILEIINTMKTSVIGSCTEQLMLTGVMPTSAQNELKVLSQITGAVFNGIITLGTEVYEDENNNGLVYTNIGGKKYSCAKVNISNSVSISSKPLSASEAYSMTATTETSVDNGSTSKKVSIEEFEETSVEESKEKEDTPVVASPVMEETKNETPVVEEPKEEFQFIPLDEASEFGETQEQEEKEEEEEENVPVVEEPVVETPVETPMVEEPQVKAPTPVVPVVVPVVDDDLSDDDDFGEETTPTPAKVEEVVPKKEETIDELDDLLDDDDFGSTEREKEIEKEEAMEEVVPETKEEAPTVVQEAIVSTFNRENMFVEESQKAIGEMVYSMSKLNLSHIGAGRPEEIIVMIAPLKMSRVASPAVPIVVALYNRGKVVCKSSYDMGDGGKAIVQAEINDFHFLCRGAFDENGKFNAFVTTTGISSQQGDRLNVISHKSYGNSQLPETKNGHIKVKYESESGEGSIEVFPFGTEEDDEFVVLVKNPEFCDVYYLSRAGRGGSVAKIYGKDGVLEVVPSWNGDILELEVFEK